MASDCRYGASEESCVRGTWSRKENADRTAPRYLRVAHSWKVFSRVLQKMPRSGVAASAVTVAYALNTLELVPFVGVELQLSAWYQVCYSPLFGLLGPMLQSHHPRE